MGRRKLTKQLAERLLWAAAVLWTAAVVVALWIPPPPVVIPNVWFDKVIHLTMFGGVGGLWRWVSDRTRARAHQNWIVLGAAIALGVLTEVGQSVLPLGRTGDPADLAFDALGAGIGIVVAALVRPPWRSPNDSRLQT